MAASSVRNAGSLHSLRSTSRKLTLIISSKRLSYITFYFSLNSYIFLKFVPKFIFSTNFPHFFLLEPFHAYPTCRPTQYTRCENVCRVVRDFTCVGHRLYDKNVVNVEMLGTNSIPIRYRYRLRDRKPKLINKIIIELIHSHEIIRFSPTKKRISKLIPSYY